MSNLNADLEAGFGDGPPVIREDQAYLLENQDQENRENTLADLRNTFEFSTIYNVIALSIPSAKTIASLIILITGNYPCIGTKQVWLICMLLHDILHSFTICLRLSIIYSLNRLNAGENGNNLNENLIQQEIQLSERNGAELPQQQNENEPPAPNQPNRRLNRSQTSRTLQIMENKERAAKLMTFCTYIWMFLFLFWLEMDAIHLFGDCDTEQINDLVFVYVIIGWIWLLNPLIFCLLGCLCLPVLVLIMIIFRKPLQTPATQSEINNLPVVLYNSDIPGNKECAICMSEYQEGERILQLQCSPLHHFHEECIKNWLNINGQCPTCRARIGQRREEDPN